MRAEQARRVASWGQHLTAHAGLEAIERARELVAACSTVAFSLGEDSLLFDGAAEFGVN